MLSLEISAAHITGAEDGRLTNPDDDNTQSFVALTKGTMVSHYRIIDKIGAGGMGDVYLAEDTDLQRQVALKFLPPHLCQDDDCRARFRREAQAVAKLDHPNIVTIYEVSDYHGRPFFAMQHVPGKSLGDAIKSEEFDLNQVIELAGQICEGLQKAHEAGIIHRDVKPSNIVIDADGRPKLLDFGLAAVRGGEHLTKTGSTLGTIGYMSPEQIEGKDTDARSDLFSLGVVIYELITSKAPFKRDDEAATLKAILRNTPEPLARYKTDVPDNYQLVINKLLEKDPTLRYQSAAGVVADLKRLIAASTATEPDSEPRKAEKSKKAVWKSLVTKFWFGCVIGITFYVVSEHIMPLFTDAPSERKMLAVLPFENLGNTEDEGFADGITDAITSRLARISGLAVIARTSVLQYKGTTKRIQEIGAELGVGYVLEGTILWDKSGDTAHVRITPQLIQVADESHLWSATYERALDEIFALQADIATTIAMNLDVTLLQPEREALADRPTDNMEAYQAYLAGGRYIGDTLMVPMYERAVQLDSNFAVAFAELSIAHSLEYHFGRDHTEARLQLAKAAVDRALKLEPDLPKAHLALGYYYYWGHREYESALRELEIAEQSLPNDPRILEAKAYIWRRQGRWEEAARNLEHAFELNPNDGGTLNAIIETYWHLRDYQAAMRLCHQSIAVFPEQGFSRKARFWLYIALDRGLDKARTALVDIPLPNRTAWVLWRARLHLTMYERDYQTALDWVDSAAAEYWSDDSHLRTMAGRKGFVYRYMGDSSRALTAFATAQIFLESHSEELESYNGFHSELGLVYAGLGRKDEAIREGRFALNRMPISKDAFLGGDRTYDLAQIYVMVEEYDGAIELLDTLMSVPYTLSIPMLKLDPMWDPLRDHPRFQALLEKYENTGN